MLPINSTILKSRPQLNYYFTIIALKKISFSDCDYLRDYFSAMCVPDICKTLKADYQMDGGKQTTCVVLCAV